MKVIVHCGMSKTGTTSLQSFLFNNSNLLLKAGILYPSLSLEKGDGVNVRPAKTHHSELILSCLESDEYLKNFGRYSEDKKEAGQRLSEELWKKLEQDVASIKPERLILSSEYICGMRPNSVKKLNNKLGCISDDINWVVYARDPVSHYLSSMQQVIKYGSQIRSPYIPYKFLQMFNKFNAQKGGTCHFRAYSKETLIRGSIISDFTKRFVRKEKIEGLKKPTGNKNTSLSAESMYILEEFNREIWGERRVPGNPVNTNFIDALKAEEAFLKCEPAKLRDCVSSIITQANLSDLERVRDTYDLDLFHKHVDPSDQVEEEPRNDWKISDIVDVDMNKIDRLLIRSIARLSKN